MTVPPFPALPARTRGPGPSLRASLILIAIGFAIGVASLIAIVVPLAGAFSSPTYAVPGEIHVHLHHARYTVYQRSGTRSGFGSRVDESAVGIDPAFVSVIGPGGVVVPVSFDTDNEKLTRGSAVYSGSLVFRQDIAGQYTLKFTNTNPTTVIVARSLMDAVRSVLVWFGTGVIGGCLLIAGIVMLIVGATRRGRVKRAMQMGWGNTGWGGPPPYGPPPEPWRAAPPNAAPTDPWAPRG